MVQRHTHLVILEQEKTHVNSGKLMYSPHDTLNIAEYSPSLCQGDYSPMFTRPEANNCFSIIFRGDYQELQNNRLIYKDTDAIIVCLLTGMQPYFYY